MSFRLQNNVFEKPSDKNKRILFQLFRVIFSLQHTAFTLIFPKTLLPK